MPGSSFEPVDTIQYSMGPSHLWKLPSEHVLVETDRAGGVVGRDLEMDDAGHDEPPG